MSSSTSSTVALADNRQQPALIIQSGIYHCALPLNHVAETMRPLPVQPFVNMPVFVLGAAVIRGQPVPVVDLARLLGAAAAAIGRFVVVHAEQRKVALAVEAVVGIRHLEDARLATVPPLLREAGPELIAALGSADERLLVVLQTARLLPDEVWQALEREHDGRQ